MEVLSKKNTVIHILWPTTIAGLELDHTSDLDPIYQYDADLC